MLRWSARLFVVTCMLGNASAQITQQAYVKASNTDAGDTFGRALDVSGDTLVVGAASEDSDATGVDGDQGNDEAVFSGAAYVLVRQAGTWSHEAYLKASNTGIGDSFGGAVAIDGNTIVVGAPFEDSNATGVDGDQSDNAISAAGAAYVFVRDGTTWTQQAYLKASNTNDNGSWGDLFGHSVAICGDTLVVGAPKENSDSTGVNGSQANLGAVDSGAAYVFVRNGTTWTQQAYVKASNTKEGDRFGHSVSLSGDTLVVGAVYEEGRAGAACVFVRDGSSWSQQAYLKASNAEAQDFFGQAVSVSGDTVVVGADGEDSGATGINGDQFRDSEWFSGAAYVFVRNGSTWSQQAYVKPMNTDSGDSFGAFVDISGDTLVSGAYIEGSGGTGVNGHGGEGFPWAGAAYIFARTGTLWTQQAYVKASNTDANDAFGLPVAVCNDTVVVGALGESSAATGVNGDQSDDSLGSAGAAYVFLIDIWNDQGGGTTGIAGPPSLSMSGPLSPASLLTLDLTDGAAFAPALVFVSFSSNPAPFLGGTLHALPFADAAWVGLDGDGAVSGSVLFPGAPGGAPPVVPGRDPRRLRADPRRLAEQRGEGRRALTSPRPLRGSRASLP